MEDGRHEVSLHFGFDVEDAIQRARKLEDTLRNLDSAISGGGTGGGMPSGYPSSGGGAGGSGGHIGPGLPTNSARTNPDMPLNIPSQGASPQQAYNNVVPHNAPPVTPSARLSNVGEGYYPLLNSLEESHFRVQQYQRQGRYDLARPEYLGQRDTIQQLMQLSEQRREEALSNADTPYERERVQYAFEHQRRGYQSQLQGVERAETSQSLGQVANLVARSGLPGSGAVANVLGGIGEGASLGAIASSVGVAAVVALAGKFLINAIDVGIQRATVVAGGSFVPESQQRTWTAQQQYGWIPFVGPRMMQITGAQNKFEGELASLGQINAGYGNTLPGSTFTNAYGTSIARTGMQSLFTERFSGDGLMGAPGFAPIKGAAAISAAYAQMLQMTPEMGGRWGQSVGFRDWGSDMMRRYDEGAAPDIIKNAVAMYGRFPFMQQRDAGSGRAFSASVLDMAKYQAGQGNMIGLTSILPAVSGLSDEERNKLINQGRAQMGLGLQAESLDKQLGYHMSNVDILRSRGLSYLSTTNGDFGTLAAGEINRATNVWDITQAGRESAGRGTVLGVAGGAYAAAVSISEEMRGRPSLTPTQYEAQQIAKERSRVLGKKAAGMDLSTDEGRLKYWETLGQSNEAMVQYATLGRERGMGMLDQYVGTLGTEAQSLSMTGYNPSKFIAAQGPAYDYFLSHQQDLMGKGVRLTEQEQAQMRLKGKQSQLGAIEATAQYYGGIATAQEQQYGAAGSAISTLYGSAASTPYALAVAGASVSVLAAAQQRLTSLQEFGAGPGLIEPAKAQVAQAYGQRVSDWVSATQFQPSPTTSESLAQSQFNLQALTTAFGTRGSVRGEYRQVQGALEQQMEELQNQRQAVMENAPPEMRQRLEFQFNQQQRSIQYQMLSTQQTLQEGWLERVMGGVWNAPNNMDLVLNQFNYAGAVGRGVRARHLGATSADVAMYQSQALEGGGGVSFQGAYGIPNDFTAAAFMGIGGMPSRSASGAVSPPGGPGVQQGYELRIVVNGQPVSSGSGAGAVDVGGVNLMWSPFMSGGASQ